MTPADIRQRAVHFRNCGLRGDAELLDALADVVEAAEGRGHGKGYEIKSAHDRQHCPLCQALARVEALQL